MATVGEMFGYCYFDDPTGPGYQGYDRDGNGSESYLPWPAARQFCLAHGVGSAIDLGCAKGFLVAELIAAGVDAVGYDISDYALSFAAGLPCYRVDIRDGIPGAAEAVFTLGVLLYLDEPELPGVLADIRRSTRRFLLFSSYYDGDSQNVSDPYRRITRSRLWWRSHLAMAGFAFDREESCFDVYMV